ncbi:hypothetical protein G9U52_10450 [Paenibacillus sp. S3N08]|uniref:Uncharacterized protein n=1 Tax=Paenibacillus agricola TaxID=2716264 RepID=A0ABX0J5Z4_9BACL|nr:hypothetical protein [Paenibacillus agricola]
MVVESEEGKGKVRPLVMFNTQQNDTSFAMLLNADYIYNLAERMPYNLKPIYKGEKST